MSFDPCQFGFIFDMDGTMILSMPYHMKAWQTLVAKFGLEMDEAMFHREIYGRNEEIFPRLFGDRFSLAEMEALGEEKEALYRALYRPEIRLLDGLARFIQEAHHLGIRLAIGTSGNRPNVNLMLEALDLAPYFRAIITAEDITQGKPHPETFLKAADTLGLPPENCLVFEDVPKGVEAALRAKMACIVLTTGHAPNAFEHFTNVHCLTLDYQALSPLKLLEVIDSFQPFEGS